MSAADDDDSAKIIPGDDATAKDDAGDSVANDAVAQQALPTLPPIAALMPPSSPAYVVTPQYYAWAQFQHQPPNASPLSQPVTPFAHVPPNMQAAYSMHALAAAQAQMFHAMHAPNMLKPVVRMPCYCGEWCRPASYEQGVDLNVSLEPPLECQVCKRHCHVKCIPTIANLRPLLLGDDFYYFKCRDCHRDPSGSDIVRRLQMSWCDVVHLALFNMSHTDAVEPAVTEDEKKYFAIKQAIVPYIDQNWLRFWSKPKIDNWMQSVTSTLSSYSPTRFVSGKHAAVGQTGIWALENARRRPSSYDTRRARIMYNLDGDGNISEEPVDHTGSKVTASKRAKAALEQQQNGEAASKAKKAATQQKSHEQPQAGSQVTVADAAPAKSKQTTTSQLQRKQSATKPRAKSSKTAGRHRRKPSVTDVPRPVTMVYLDLPNVLDAPVTLSNQTTHTAPQVKVTEGGLVASNEKGYRMAKSTNGVEVGSWFFEVTIMPTDEAHSNVRIGWSQISGDLQAPCGFDAFSYSFRPSPNTVFHQSKGRSYGRCAGPGDTIGILIKLPEDTLAEETECDPWPAPWAGQAYVPVKYEGDLPVHRGSEIRFFINGEEQGMAFENLLRGKYHAAVSMYMGGTVQVNFGNTPFQYPPACDFSALACSATHIAK